MEHAFTEIQQQNKMIENTMKEVSELKLVERAQETLTNLTQARDGILHNQNCTERRIPVMEMGQDFVNNISPLINQNMKLL